MKSILGWLVLAVAVVMGASACGSFDEANLHNAASPPKSTDTVLTWHRVDSPPNYPTIVTACYGADGVYIDQDSSNSVDVVANDPRCAG